MAKNRYQQFQAAQKKPEVQDVQAEVAELLEDTVETTETEEVQEVEVVEIQTQEPVVQEVSEAVAPKKVDPNLEVKQSTIKANSIEAAFDNVGPVGRVTLQQIRDYSIAMASNAVKTPQYVAANNSKLYFTLFNIFNNVPAEEFDSVYRAMLSEVRENKTGAWNELTIFGGIEHIDLSETQWAAYRRFVRLVLDSCDAVKFKELSSNYNWGEVMAYQLSDEARNRIRSFYRI